jgi:hypothetical protein
LDLWGIKWQEIGENCVTRSSIICISLNKGRWVQHAVHMGEDKKSIQNWFKSPKGTDHLEETGIDGTNL